MIRSKVINYVFVSFVFLVSRKETKSLIDYIHNRKIGYMVYKPGFYFWEAIIPTVFVALLIYTIYEILTRVFKVKNIVSVSLLTGGIPFASVLIFFTMYSGNRDLPLLVLGVLPFLITGLVLPFSEKLAKNLLHKTAR